MINRRMKLWDRIVSRVSFDHDTGCWNWTGSHSGHGRGGGYGRISIDGSSAAVHRVMYILQFGYIHQRQQVDHTCGNRLCCNPNHLEAVTHTENQRRKTAVSPGK